ncbi:hypothetical protein LSAT2_028306, partial [Lamellibrachia satsuma]
LQELCRYDSLDIFDGNATTAPRLRSLCGSNLPRDIVSSGNTMLVYFATNNINRYAGFMLKYTAIDAHCMPGEYLVVLENRCKACERGTYQSQPSQETCDECPEGKTTLGQRHRNSADCITNCPNGTEYDTTSGSCEPCPQGAYRTQNIHDMCIPCPQGKTTRTSGTSTIDKCDIADCPRGQHFKDSTKQQCSDCKRGYYQDMPWQDDCIKCPDSKTTASTGTTSVTDCKRNCDSGLELDEAAGECVLCPRGFYRDKAQHFSCQSCPRHLVTPGRGATAATDCHQGNCTAGQNIEGKTCQTCPRGTYQDKKWQPECLPCGHMMTTAREGATAEDECFSTDSCANNGQNNCTATDNGGTCALVDDGPDYTCGCRDGWSMDSGTACTHKCDRGYCLNGATCNKDIPESPVCICANGYQGVRCSRPDGFLATPAPERGSPNTLYMIGGGAGGFVLLLVVVILCVCYFVRRTTTASNDGRPPDLPPAFHNLAYEPSSAVEHQDVGEPEHTYETLDAATMNRRDLA